MKDGRVEEYDRVPRPVPFEIQMDDGKAKRENRGYTFADFVAAANYLHKQISTGANSTRWQCFAVPTMQSSLDPPLPFSPCCVLAPPHNDFWLVTLTYAQYFEQTPAFYFYIRRNRSFATRGTINSSTGCVASRRVARRGE